MLQATSTLFSSASSESGYSSRATLCSSGGGTISLSSSGTVSDADEEGCHNPPSTPTSTTSAPLPFGHREHVPYTGHHHHSPRHSWGSMSGGGKTSHRAGKRQKRKHRKPQLTMVMRTPELSPSPEPPYDGDMVFGMEDEEIVSYCAPPADECIARIYVYFQQLQRVLTIQERQVGS